MLCFISLKHIYYNTRMILFCQHLFLIFSIFTSRKMFASFAQCLLPNTCNIYDVFTFVNVISCISCSNGTLIRFSRFFPLYTPSCLFQRNTTYSCASTVTFCKGLFESNSQKIYISGQKNKAGNLFLDS